MLDAANAISVVGVGMGVNMYQRAGTVIATLGRCLGAAAIAEGSMILGQPGFPSGCVVVGIGGRVMG